MSAGLERMDADTARVLTDRIRAGAMMTWELVREAYEARAWEALGYGTWDLYVRSEFADVRLQLPAESREEKVSSLRDAGMSLREIAAVSGVSKDTIARAAVSPETRPDVLDPIPVDPEHRRVAVEPIDGVMPDGRSPGSPCTHDQIKAIHDMIRSVPDDQRPPLRGRVIRECDAGERWPTHMVNQEWYEIFPVLEAMAEGVEALTERVDPVPVPEPERLEPEPEQVDRSDIPRRSTPIRTKEKKRPAKDERRAPTLAKVAVLAQLDELFDQDGLHEWDESLLLFSMAEQDDHRALLDRLYEKIGRARLLYANVQQVAS